MANVKWKHCHTWWFPFSPERRRFCLFSANPLLVPENRKEGQHATAGVKSSHKLGTKQVKPVSS